MRSVKSARILVVDDEPAAQRLLSRILTKIGHRPDAVSDIVSAVRLLEGEPFDLVMTDLDMPGGSGFELIDSLASRSPQIATILVTGRGSTQVASQALMSGAYGYLSKPFMQEEVHITVLNALRRRELELANLQQRALLEETVRERTSDLAASLAALQVAQEELEEKASQLQELDVLKSRFIQVISHELRTPLTVIKGGVQTVLRAGADSDPAFRAQLLQSTEKAADELGHMINKILTVATIRHGGFETEPAPLWLDKLVRQVCDAASTRARGRITVRATEARALGDPRLVEQVVRDLVHNALVHTKGSVVVSAWELGDQAVVSVKDEGPAPSQSLLERLFDEPFVQADSSTTREVGGMGLSLYLAKQVIEASGGTLGVETSEDGSTFSIALPTRPMS